MEIKDFGITLRLVEIDDAEFILKLRTDSNKSKFISKISNDLLTQIRWLQDYKKREHQKKEYYFIALDQHEQEFATYRIYNIGLDSIEIGSWVTVNNTNKPIDAVKVDFLVKRFVFENLGYKKLNFDVRKDNKSVINYHKKYGSQIINEDNLNYYFELSHIEFNKNKNFYQRKFH